MAVNNALLILKRAFSVYGAEETPRGSNILPPELANICRQAGWRQADRAPWCLYFALGCVRLELSAAGIAIPDHLQSEGSTGQFLERADEAGKVITQPAFGAIGIFLRDGKPFHAGVCLGPSDVFDGHAVHIEGNTNDNGDPDGYEVCIRHRPIENTRWVVW